MTEISKQVHYHDGTNNCEDADIPEPGWFVWDETGGCCANWMSTLPPIVSYTPTPFLTAEAAQDYHERYCREILG